MSIVLFKHNQSAYEAATAMLSETGKSFICLKLCEDNSDKTVCWFSPSEYIFKTQLENLKKTSAETPQNIRFFTYAKLMYISNCELAEINPNFIILDEFHRCGAEAWGKRVNFFLNMYKNIPTLGLSATNVRYLDNQRDMAEELFDGNIASEMTLGEAIVREILKAPLYISTVFSYQKELEKYTRMAKMPKFKAVRDTAEKYLEELRRTIEKLTVWTLFLKNICPTNAVNMLFSAPIGSIWTRCFCTLTSGFLRLTKIQRCTAIIRKQAENLRNLRQIRAKTLNCCSALICLTRTFIWTMTFIWTISTG